MTYEGLRLKYNTIIRKGLANYRNKNIKNKKFTIISNNCWAGEIYESYNLIKQSPTVGLYIMPKDYLKMLSNLKYYLKCNLEFISPNMSKWQDFLRKNDSKFGTYPIGILDDVELFFLHYKDEKQAKEKWERRINRISWDHLLVKFNDQNGCTEEDIMNFEKLNFKHKICFTAKEYLNCKSVISVNVPKKFNFVKASYEPYGKNRYVDIDDIINNL